MLFILFLIYSHLIWPYHNVILHSFFCFDKKTELKKQCFIHIKTVVDIII